MNISYYVFFSGVFLLFIEVFSDELEFIFGMSFFYENYNEDVWYWELVEVVRKLVLICGIILIGCESRVYVGLVFICFGLFVIVYVFCKFIKDDFEDKL